MARSVRKRTDERKHATTWPLPRHGSPGEAQGSRTTKAEKKAAKAEARTARAESRARGKNEKRAAKAEKKGEHGRFTPGNTKKAIGVAKILAPVLAPFAAKAAATTRDRYDRIRARRLGVPVEDLGRFSGRGAALHARIAGDADALQDLRSKSGDHQGGRSSQEDSPGSRTVDIEQFADNAEKRLSQLTSAVRAAERMPSGRRRAAHRAVAGELNRIEDDLLRRFDL